LTDGRGGGRRARGGWAGGWPSRRPREEHGWAVTSLVGGGAQAGDGLMGGGGAHVAMRSTGLSARERSTGVEVLFRVTLSARVAGLSVNFRRPLPGRWKLS
jgi:hypothetical protein